MTDWLLPEEVLREAPSYTPRAHELSDLELLLSVAYQPLSGFLGNADLEAVSRRGKLSDGTPWPVPVTLEVPAEVTERFDMSNPMRRVLVLTDPEGAPVAAVEVAETWPADTGWSYVSGPVRRLAEPEHGVFRRLRCTPAEVRETLPSGRVLGVIPTGPLHRPQLAQIAHAARTLAAHVLVLIPVAEPAAGGLPPEVLVRTVLAAADRMPPATIIAVPIASRGDEIRDALLRSRVAAAYGVTHLISTGAGISGTAVRVVVPRELMYDTRDGQWRSADDVPPPQRRLPLSQREIDGLLDRGAKLPEWHTPPAVAEELRRARPPRDQRGLVVFFTGLSGSGKSTIARGVHDVLLEDGERSVTLLDGDVIRRLLSSDLRFSRGDRDLNIRRIGFVAAEAARHGGVALCCPIAPYAATRAEIRAMVRAVGGDFVLVHVATPLEVCEQRDRKGLYAKARAGQIPAFTGVSDPYEEPTDADLVLDTQSMNVNEAVEAVLDHLATGGWLELDGLLDSPLRAGV
ncbi:MAG: adenylyl-sulfate kinase [Micromonosporaceae bacterium]|nr:adenylyl-sulfate kinase [Micromonosporaceae bacterium]